MTVPELIEAVSCADDCQTCLGTGSVCIRHPEKAWLDGSCCPAPSMPCPLATAARERAREVLER